MKKKLWYQKPDGIILTVSGDFITEPEIMISTRIVFSRKAVIVITLTQADTHRPVG